MAHDLQPVFERLEAIRVELSGKLDAQAKQIGDLATVAAVTASQVKAHAQVDHQRPCGALRTLTGRLWGLVAAVLVALALGAGGLLWQLAAAHAADPRSPLPAPRSPVPANPVSRTPNPVGRD